jgi:hypothetical protein
VKTANFFSEGDKSQAICADCKKVRTTTFGYRDVPFSDGRSMVKNILVGVCDHCGNVASIPAQSTPAISMARTKSSESVEAILPAPYIELLDLACFKIDPNFSLDLRKAILMFYVQHFASGAFELSRLKASSKALAKRPSMESKVRRRLSMKTSQRLAHELDTVANLSSMKKTQTIKAIIGTIQEDIVNDGRPDLIKDFKEYAVFAAV